MSKSVIIHFFQDLGFEEGENLGHVCSQGSVTPAPLIEARNQTTYGGRVNKTNGIKVQLLIQSQEMIQTLLEEN